MVVEVLLSPLVFNGLVFLISLIILFYSADLLIDGISEYAQKLGLSDEIIGFIVVAMAASMPEVVASLGGLASGHADLLFGTLIGNNMVHTALLIGGLTVVAGTTSFKSKLLAHSKLFVWALLTLPFILALDGLISRGDGIILVGAFGAYLLKLWQKEKRFMKLKKYVHPKDIWKNGLVFLGALVSLILAGRYLVFSAIVLSTEFHVPPYFIALSVIAVASTMPDFAVGIRAIFKGQTKIGLGEIIGSMIIELLLFIGIISIVNPIVVNVAQVWTSALFLFVSITISFYYIHLGSIKRWQGMLLILWYAVFLTIEILKVV